MKDVAPLHNGRNPLNWAAALLVVFAAVGVLLVAVSFATANGEPFAPLSIAHLSINSRIEGIDGPAVQAGRHYNGTITICNGDDQEQTITFIIQFERLEGPVRFVSGGSVEFPVQPGCETFTGDSAPLPDSVTPGLWRESTAASVQRGDERQTITFTSEPFEVLP